MKELIEKGLRDAHINIRGYYSLDNQKIYKKFQFSNKYTTKDRLLIMSATQYTFDTKGVKLIDTLYLPLTYRYNIEDIDKNKIIHLKIYIYLLKKVKTSHF